MKVSEIKITGYVPGAIGRVSELHALYYNKYWGFGQFFEAKVATELSEFLSRFDSNRDGFWIACLEGHVEGSITIDGIKADTDSAHLRWFILSDTVRGRGIGNQLMKEAIRFCKEKRYRRVYLWTFEGLQAARHLYEKFGFRLIEQHEGEQWGRRVIEQKFMLEMEGEIPAIDR